MSNNSPSSFSQKPPKPLYFGGSRSLPRSEGLPHLIWAILRAANHPAVHVGCQVGADLEVANAVAVSGAALHLFVVAPESQAPLHVRALAGLAASVTYSAGGNSASIKARYLLRSKAAFHGCQAAIFFCPGRGSLAVAREAIAAGLPVYAFQQEPPAPIPSTAGTWQRGKFLSFVCWQWQSSQASFF